MKNSSGAIGAAKAPPYLVSHRRIINVIRIMYPRNSDRQGSPAGLRRKKEGDGELRRERRVFMLWDISRRYQSVRGKRGRRWKGQGRGGGACTKGTPTVPSRSFTPSGAYILPPQPRSPRSPRCDASPDILHLPLFTRTPKRYCSTRVATCAHVCCELSHDFRRDMKVKKTRNYIRKL